jgi:hypothetical protein
MNDCLAMRVPSANWNSESCYRCTVDFRHLPLKSGQDIAHVSHLYNFLVACHLGVHLGIAMKDKDVTALLANPHHFEVFWMHRSSLTCPANYISIGQGYSLTLLECLTGIAPGIPSPDIIYNCVSRVHHYKSPITFYHSKINERHEQPLK